MADLNLTKRQQEIVDFIKTLLGASTAIRPPCATSARRSASRRRRPSTRTSPTWRRSGCCAATPQSRARSSCWWTRPRRWRGRAGGLPAGRPGRGRSAGARGGEHRGVRRCPAAGRRGRGRVRPRVSGDSMLTRASTTATTWSCAAGHRRDGEIVVALVGDAEATVKRFFRRPTASACSRRTTTIEPIASSDVKVLGSVVGVLQESR